MVNIYRRFEGSTILWNTGNYLSVTGRIIPKHFCYVAKKASNFSKLGSIFVLQNWCRLFGVQRFFYAGLQSWGRHRSLCSSVSVSGFVDPISGFCLQALWHPKFRRPLQGTNYWVTPWVSWMQFTSSHIMFSYQTQRLSVLVTKTWSFYLLLVV